MKIQISVSATAAPVDLRTYQKFKYTAARGTNVTLNNGKATLKFTNGTLFGIKEFNSKQDTIVLLSDKTKVYKISIDTCDKLVAKSDDYKGSVKEAAAPKATPKAAPKATAKPKATTKVAPKVEPKAAPKAKPEPKAAATKSIDWEKRLNKMNSYAEGLVTIKGKSSWVIVRKNYSQSTKTLRAEVNGTEIEVPFSAVSELRPAFGGWNLKVDFIYTSPAEWKPTAITEKMYEACPFFGTYFSTGHQGPTGTGVILGLGKNIGDTAGFIIWTPHKDDKLRYLTGELKFHGDLNAFNFGMSRIAKSTGKRLSYKEFVQYRKNAIADFAVLRDLGLDVSKTSNPEDTVERVRAAVTRFN